MNSIVTRILLINGLPNRHKTIKENVKISVNVQINKNRKLNWFFPNNIPLMLL